MVPFYKDILGFHTDWKGGDFAEYETASGALSFFMYSRKEFVKAIKENYLPPQGINQTFEIGFWLPSFAGVDVHNTPSCCVLEKCGFTREGLTRQGKMKIS